MSADQDPSGGRRPGRVDMRQMYRTLGMGVELGVVIGGMTYVGYMVDQRYGTTPWVCAIGSMMGIIGGCYNVVKEVQKSQKRK